MVAFEHLLVQARAVVVAVYPGLRHQLAQVVVARLVLGQQHQVPPAAVLLGFLEGVRAACAVGFHAHDGLEQPVLRLGAALLQGSALVVGQAVGLQLLVNLLQLVAHLAVLFCGIVQQFLDAEHVAVVGQRHGRHAVGHAFVDQVGYFRHAVEDGVVRVYV